MKPLLAGVALLAVAACARAPSAAPEASGHQRLSGQEIAAALTGNSLAGSDRGGDYVIWYSNAKDMKIRYRGRYDQGVWRIRGDEYCRRWNQIGKGKERCVAMYGKNRSILWLQDGEITDRSRLLPGNPARL